MSISMKETQVFCQRCRSTFWFDVPVDTKDHHAGLRKKSLIHNDHVLICDIDNNGVVRASSVVEIEFNPLQILIDDVAQGLHYLNGDSKNPIIMDFYTSNVQFMNFIQAIIIKMFEQATKRKIDDKFSFTVSTCEDTTELKSDKLHLSVGPYIKQKSKKHDKAIKGLVLDIQEAEKNKIDIESLIEQYSWVAVMVQREKNEGYSHALSSLFSEKGYPFYIETLSNSALRELFDFIFAVTLEEEPLVVKKSS